MRGIGPEREGAVVEQGMAHQPLHSPGQPGRRRLLEAPGEDHDRGDAGGAPRGGDPVGVLDGERGGLLQHQVLPGLGRRDALAEPLETGGTGADEINLHVRR